MAAQRADANAALAAQRADANTVMDTLRAILGKQDAAMERERASAKEISAAHYKALQLAGAREVAEARHDADVATGRVNARVLLEESLAVIWRTWEALDTDAREKSGVSTRPRNATEQLQSLLRLRGVAAYLEVVEEDNRLASGVLVKSASIMYSALCTPLHSRGVEGAHRLLPHEVFEAIGENGLIAFAALVALSRRDVGLYLPKGDTKSLQLRVHPSEWIAATKQEFKASPALNVLASMDLGVTPLEEEVQQ